MASKAKFQISKSLDERIKSISSNPTEFEPKFENIEWAAILGFQCGNTSNYVGLTTDNKLNHASMSILGFVWFNNKPNDEQISATIKSHVKESQDCSSISQDLFLIYILNEDTNKIDKKIFSYETGNFLESQPKLSVLDDSKIYNHSTLIKLTFYIKLDINDGKKLRTKDALERNLNELNSNYFSGLTDKIKLHLKKSNYSIKLTEAKDKIVTESLYDYLDVPDGVLQMGDYLPQITKEDKKKLGDKWKNKMKTLRAPLEFTMEHCDLSYNEDEDDSKDQLYRYKMQLFYYLHVNDSILKSVQSLLQLIRNNIEILKRNLIESKRTSSIEANELKCCTFKPTNVGHLVQIIYQLPSDGVQYEFLTSIRSSLHMTYLVPLKQPQFRFSQRLTNVEMKNSDEESGYLCNVHKDIAEQSGIKQGLKNIIGGTYTYHHYLQDRAQDNGWGCAYRSLQTIISWFKHQAYIYSPDVEVRAPSSNKTAKMDELRKLLHMEARVPSHEEIQSVLVAVGDKQHSFIGSQKWIGSQEVCYVLNHLYNLDSKFISVSSGSELVYKARDLASHFQSQSTPVMIGGGVLAHTIIGIDFNEKNGDTSYLILDPHYTGSEDLATITKKGWCGWKKNSFWDKGAFYNLCLPQRPNDEI